MVEINNQRKAFLDMLAWSEGTDNGRQKNQKSWLWRHCRRRAIYWLLRSPSQTCHAKNPKLKSTGAGRYQLLSVGGMPTARNSLKDFSPKSQDAVALQQIKERGGLPMIDRGDIRQAIDRCAISGLHCRALVMVSSSIRLTAWLQNLKEAGGTVRRDWCMSRVTAIISALVICIIVCLSWAVNHYRDNAITYKAQRDKKCQRTEIWTRQLLTCRCVSVMLLRSMQNTRELADAKAENDALRDDVAAGRRRLHYQSSLSGPREATTASGVDTSLSTGRHRWTGLFHPQREADHYAKTTGREPRSILMSIDRVAYTMGNSCNTEQYTRASSGVANA